MESKEWGAVKKIADLEWIEDEELGMKMYIPPRPTSDAISCETSCTYKFAPIERIKDYSWISSIQLGDKNDK
jgi:hypothetical protein